MPVFTELVFSHDFSKHFFIISCSAEAVSVSLSYLLALYFAKFAKLRAGRSGVRVPVRARDFLFFKTPSPVLGPNQPPIQLVPTFFPGGKTAGP